MMPLDEAETIWRPQYREDGSRGPQFALLTCPADEIFFGGARGGGKSSGMLGHWVAHAQKYGNKARGVFFRRRFKQLEEVQRQANEIFPKLGAVYSKGEAIWTFPNGAVLKLRHLWDAQVAEEYQGHSYCVAAGTPVLMGDGTYLPIEQIRVGDLVMTLEGPKPVQAVMKPRISPCVRARVFDASGVFVGEQIHPEAHPVLTSVSAQSERRSSISPSCGLPQQSRVAAPEQEPHLSVDQAPACPDIASHRARPIGPELHRSPVGLRRTSGMRQGYPDQWQSYTTLLDAHRGSRGSSACLEGDRSGYTSSEDSPQEALRLPRLSCPVVLRVPDHRSNPPCPPVSTRSRVAGKSSRPLSGIVRAMKRWLRGLRRLLEPGQSHPDCGTRHLQAGGDEGARNDWRTVEGSQEHCSRGFGQCDEQLHLCREGGLSPSPLPSGVAEHIHQKSCLDEEDCIQEHNHLFGGAYVHPYTYEHRTLSQPYEYGTVFLEPCGDHVVYDLSICDANHYITSSQLINCNTWVCMEELTQWGTLDAMNKLRGTLRSSDGVKCVMLATGNPGGPGHNVVKQRYIDPAPGGYTPITDPETGLTRVFIPSRLEDNLALVRNDPTYERRLMSVGNAQLVKAWRWGDWNVTFGGAFDDLWSPHKHILKPFPLPRSFTFRRSFDWGSAAPACLQKWAISDGTPIREMGGFVFPRGSMILFDEWYTVAKKPNGETNPNIGLRLTNRALGKGIAERSKGYQWEGCVADPSIFTHSGMESIYEDMRKGALEAKHNLIFAHANNERIAGWQRMRDMLENAAADYPEKPGLWVFSNCIHFLRTVPTLQRDETKPDDIDTDQEDHSADSARYALMSTQRRMSIGRARFSP